MDNDDGSDQIYGTSYAAPQVSAAAAIMQSNGLYNFEEAKNIFHNMDWYEVCPDGVAEEGQVLDAYDADSKTTDSPI